METPTRLPYPGTQQRAGILQVRERWFHMSMKFGDGVWATAGPISITAPLTDAAEWKSFLRPTPRKFVLGMGQT